MLWEDKIFVIANLNIFGIPQYNVSDVEGDSLATPQTVLVYGKEDWFALSNFRGKYIIIIPLE